MLKISHFLWLNAALAALLVAFITLGLRSTFEPGFYVFAHAMLAAVLTAVILRVIVRRRMSLIGSPLASVLIVSDLYFTLNSVKYFVPNRAYTAFTQTDLERFLASLAAWVVLMAGVGLLAVLPRMTVQQFQTWWHRDRTLRATLYFTLLASTAGRLFLYAAGYGGGYANTEFSAARIRTYWDLLIMSGTGFLELVAFVLGACFIVDGARTAGRRLWTMLASVLAIVFALLWAGYAQARMPFLFLMLLAMFAMQVRSHKRAMLALQLFLLVLPITAVTGANVFTSLLGRGNVGGFTLRETVGELGYRADLTDLAAAIYIRGKGAYAGSAVVVDAVSNAVPRVFWPGKDDYYTNAYYTHIVDIGMPRVDYIETPFSNGVVAYGAAGFVLWPLTYMLLLGMVAGLTRVAPIGARARALGLITLGLLAMRVENEWEGVMLLFRDYFLLAPILIGLTTVILAIREKRHNDRIRRAERLQASPAGLGAVDPA
jgi:hypothetical protein